MIFISRLHKSQSGFGHHIIIPIVVIVMVGAIGGYVLSKSHAQTPVPQIDSNLVTPAPLIVFNGGKTANTNYIYTASSSGTVKNTKIAGSLPTWSSNGSKIFYANPAGTAVYSMSPDGLNAKRITPVLSDGSFITSIAWSETAKKLAIYEGPYNSGTTNTAIYTLNADGTNYKKITSGTITEVLALQWSPGGNRLLFYSAGFEGKKGIFAINSDGSGMVNIVVGVNSILSTHNAWSPNGSQITYTAGGSGNIHIVNSNGSGNQVVVTCSTVNGNDCYNPTWSPDGSRLAYGTYSFGSTAQLHIINLASKHNIAASFTGSNGLGDIDWSPSSGAIAVDNSAGASSDQIYSVNSTNLAKTRLGTVQYSAPASTTTLDWSIQ